jgi:hypothetical protein
MDSTLTRWRTSGNSEVARKGGLPDEANGR